MPSVGLRIDEAPEARVIGVINNRNGSAHESPVEKLVALLAGGFSDQLTAMTSSAMGWADVEFVVGIMLGAEGVVAAQLPSLESPFQIGNDPLACINKAAECAFRSRRAGKQENAVTDLGVGVDPFSD